LLRNRQLWIGVIGTALFLGLFFAFTNLREMGEALADANYWWFAPAIAVWFLSAWFRSLRWRYLLQPMGSFSAQTLYPIIVIGYMANNLLPARTGELVRAYIMDKKYRLSIMATLGTIAVERLFDGLVLVVFLIAVGAFVGLSRELGILAAAMSATFVLVFALFLFVASSRERAERWSGRLLRFLPARAREKGSQWASSFVEGLAALQSPWRIGAVLVTSVVAWALESTMYFMVGVAFDLGEAFPIFMMVAAAANLAITLPSTSGGIGPFELLTKETLEFVGVSGGVAGAYAAALHALVLLPVVAAGLVFLWAINLSLAETLRRPAQPGLATPTGGGSPSAEGLGQEEGSE
jgi:uncharacterized protein (TIRG00374 family)